MKCDESQITTLMIIEEIMNVMFNICDFLTFLEIRHYSTLKRGKQSHRASITNKMNLSL